MERYALTASIRLKQNNVWRDRGYKEGHCKIVRNRIADGLYLDNTEISSKWRAYRHFNITIAIRLSYKLTGAVEYFSDASVKEDECGIGWIRFENGRQEFYAKLEFSCDNNRSELIALRAAVEHALSLEEEGLCFNFWTDSLRTVEELKKPLTTNKDTWLCTTALNLLAKENTVQVSWLSKKTSAQGLIRADELAKLGRAQDREIFRNTQSSHYNTKMLDSWEVDEKIKVWQKMLTLNGFHTSKLTMNGFDDRRLKDIYNKGRRNMRLITAIFTGAAPLNGHLSKIKRQDGLRYTDLCRFCKDETENVLHLLGDCMHWKVRAARLKAFGTLDIKGDSLRKREVKEFLIFANQIRLAEIILIRRTEEDEMLSSLEDFDDFDDMSISTVHSM